MVIQEVVVFKKLFSVDIIVFTLSSNCKYPYFFVFFDFAKVVAVIHSSMVSVSTLEEYLQPYIAYKQCIWQVYFRLLAIFNGALAAILWYCHYFTGALEAIHSVKGIVFILQQ